MPSESWDHTDPATQGSDEQSTPFEGLIEHAEQLDSQREHIEKDPLGPGSYRIDDLYGYDRELERLLEMGVFSSVEDDEFLRQMSLQHGIDALPSQPVLVFRSSAREDADKLMLAVAAEMGRPTVRMRVDNNDLAGSVLCVIAANGYDPRASLAHGGMALPEILILEGIDSWVPSESAFLGFPDYEDAQLALSKGAYRTLAMIRAAIDDPQVTVFASACRDFEVSPWLESFLEPVKHFDIDDPDEDSRDAIWDHLMDVHPSLSALDRYELVRLSAGMCRCDIETAAREAVQQAFSESMAKRAFQPVSRGNILDKIAAYQPLDSKEYLEIEESLVEDLRDEIEQYLQSHDAQQHS